MQPLRLRPSGATSTCMWMDVVVADNSNTLSLRLLPCDVFARTAVVGQEVAAFEVLVAQSLGAVSAPIASLDPRVEARVYRA